MNEKQLIKLLTEGDKVSAGFKAMEDDPSLVRGGGVSDRPVGMVRELGMGYGGGSTTGRWPTRKHNTYDAFVHMMNSSVRISPSVYKKYLEGEFINLNDGEKTKGLKEHTRTDVADAMLHAYNECCPSATRAFEKAVFERPVMRSIGCIAFNPELETVTDDQGRERHATTLLEKDSDGFGVKFSSIRNSVRGL